MPGAAVSAAEAGPNRGHRRCHARQGTQEFSSAEDSDAEDTVVGAPAAMGRQHQGRRQQRPDDDGGERAGAAAAPAVDGGLDGLPPVAVAADDGGDDDDYDAEANDQQEEHQELCADPDHPSALPPLSPPTPTQHQLPPYHGRGPASLHRRPRGYFPPGAQGGGGGGLHPHHYHPHHLHQGGGGSSSTGAQPAASPPPGEARTRLLLPATRTGMVIGRGGDVVRGICETTGAHVSIASPGAEDRPDQYRLATVTGSVMAVCWAVELVAQKAGLFEGHSQIDPIFVSRKYSVPDWQPQPPPPAAAEGGGAEGAASADGAKKEERQPPGVKMVIDTSTAGSLIGKGGVTISEIRAQSRARVLVLDENESRGEGAVPGERVVLVIGAPEACRKAHQLVSAALTADYHAPFLATLPYDHHLQPVSAAPPHHHAQHQYHQHLAAHAHHLAAHHHHHHLAGGQFPTAGTPSPLPSFASTPMGPRTPSASSLSSPSSGACSASAASANGSPHLSAFAFPVSGHHHHAHAHGARNDHSSAAAAAAEAINMGLLAHSMSHHLSLHHHSHGGGSGAASVASSPGGSHYSHLAAYTTHAHPPHHAFLPPRHPSAADTAARTAALHQRQHLAPSPQPVTQAAAHATVAAPPMLAAVYGAGGFHLYPTAAFPLGAPHPGTPKHHHHHLLLQQQQQQHHAQLQPPPTGGQEEEGAAFDKEADPAAAASIPGTEAEEEGGEDEQAPEAEPGEDGQASVEVILRVPGPMIARLVGKEGETLRRIRGESGCQVTISSVRPPGTGEPAPACRMLRVQGSIEQAQLAQRLIAAEMAAAGAGAAGGQRA